MAALSDKPASALSFPKLNRDNYKSWKFNIDLFLLSQDLGEFTSDSPVPETSPDKGETSVAELSSKVKDKKALAIICLSVEEDLKSIVYEASSPYQAWVLLKAVFEPTSRARIAALRRKFMNIKFDDLDSMSDYINKVLNAAKDLKLAGKEIPGDEIAFQVLENLPDSYENLVIHLYRLPDAEFTVEEIRKQLLAEYDRQLCRSPVSIDRNQALISSKQEHRYSRTERLCFACGKPGHLKQDCRIRYKPKDPVRFQRKLPVVQPRTNTHPKQAYFAAAHISETTEMEFVLDSAATDHFVNKKEVIQNFREMNSSASIAKGSTRILGVGDVTIKINAGTVSKTLFLKNVYFAPEMTRNLISIRSLSLSNFNVHFYKNKAVIDYNGNEFLDIPLRNKFYAFSAVCSDELTEAHIANNDVMFWHMRYCHLNSKALMQFLKSKNVIGIDKLTGETSDCEICNFAKSKRISFPEIDNIQTSNILELLHLDIWGPSPVASLGGARYFMTITDDYSRYSFVYILKHKNQAFKYFKDFKVFVERQKNRKIKRIRTDCGGEFCGKHFEDYLREQGIKHERTNTYSPEMNGLAERQNRSLMEGVRSLLIQSKLPKNLWAELVCTQNYIKNRFPHKKLKGKAPLNVWIGKSFSVKHLKVIGSPAYVHIPTRYRNKLEERAKKGVIVGYASSTVGYRIWYPGTTMIQETKHVKINEDDTYPYHKVKNGKNENFVDIGFSDILDINEGNKPLSKPPEKVEGESKPPEISKIDWKRVEVERKTGKTAGKIDVYYYPEDGVRLRSKNDIRSYCEQKKVDFNPDDFNFKPTSKSRETSEGDDSDIEAHCVEIKVPSSYKESQNLPEKQKWLEAMERELKTLKERDVYELVPRPGNAKVLGSKWVFTLKRDERENVKCFKTRLVARGFKQVEGIDYFDTFSPVISFSLVRYFFVALVIVKGWLHYHLDIKCAYLYAKLNELIFIEQPEGFQEKGKENFVMKLKRALYGLHQAGREWYFELDKTFLEMGFEKVKNCNCIYTYKFEVVLLVYVDDIAIFAKNKLRLEEIIKIIKSKFEVKVLGKIKNFLGVEFEEIEGEIHMHQKTYIKRLIEIFKNIPKIKCKLPLTPSVVLNTTVNGEEARDVPYRKLIGCLLFLASRTRPDIQFSVIALSQFSNNPSHSHWKFLCQVFQYVCDNRNFTINLSRSTNCNLNIYTDASWASSIVDRKSISGYVIFIDTVPIIWNSAKQKCTALSSMEAEYIALSDSIKELCWLLKIINNLDFLNLSTEKPIVYCDNQSTICFSKNDIENSRTKYIDTRLYFVKENLEKFELKFVSGKANIADIFTKSLPSERFNFYCKYLFD